MQCPHCGADREYSRSHYHGTSFECGTFLLHDTMNGDIGLDCIAKVGRQLAAANERAGRLEELRKDAWAMLLAIASGNGPFEKKMTRADMMEAARQSAEALEVPDAL